MSCALAELRVLSLAHYPACIKTEPRNNRKGKQRGAFNIAAATKAETVMRVSFREMAQVS